MLIQEIYIFISASIVFLFGILVHFKLCNINKWFIKQCIHFQSKPLMNLYPNCVLVHIRIKGEVGAVKLV